jgi:hypothetical protein
LVRDGGGLRVDEHDGLVADLNRGIPSRAHDHEHVALDGQHLETHLSTGRATLDGEQK